MTKQEDRTLRTTDLQKAVELAKKKGYKVYTFESSSRYIEQVFFENLAGEVGTASTYYSGVKFSTIHKSKNGSGNGTGFGQLVKGQEFDSPEDIDICFITYPYWLRGNKAEVYKYISFADYLEKGLKILKYYEL